MRTLGTHRKAVRSRTMPNSKNTVGHDSKVLIRKKPTEATNRDKRRIEDTNLRMAMDDLRNNHVTEESQTWRNKWKVPPMVTTRRSTWILLSAVIQERTERFDRLAGFPDAARNMSMGS